MNNKLLMLIIVLIPISIISFFFKETNFIMQEKNKVLKSIQVPLTTPEETINIDLEEYVIGVVAGEMPALFHEEALKAQAIASRTYIINHLSNNKVVTGTTADQVYLNIEEMKEKWQKDFFTYYNKIKKAVLSTESKIMLYENKPIKAYYFSKSNGYTESSLNVFNEQRDYLDIIESPFDKDNSHKMIISKQEFCTKLELECDEIKISNIVKDKSNRVSTISINSRNYKGTEVRKLLSLRSTDFSFEIKKDNIEITTKGYGHGVGMSQYGANNMAKMGFTHEEILKYYYKEIEIADI